MKKIILTAIMVLTLLNVGLIDFSYAKDLSKGIPELKGTEMTEENVPIIFAQANTSTSDEKVDVEKEDEPDEDEDVDEEDVDDEDVEVGVERRRIRERR